MAITGESITNRRIKTSSARLIDGGFVDAGTAMIISSNLAHLQLESLRHLFSSLGPGSITNGVRGYANITDASDPGAYAGEQLISWAKGTAIRLGSYYSIQDREGGTGTLKPRKLRFNFDATGTALTLIACATLPGNRPDNRLIALSTVAVNSGRSVYSLELEPVISSASAVPCRRPDTASASDVSATFFDVWVGWYSASGTSALISLTCNEVR